MLIKCRLYNSAWICACEICKVCVSSGAVSMRSVIQISVVLVALFPFILSDGLIVSIEYSIQPWSVLNAWFRYIVCLLRRVTPKTSFSFRNCISFWWIDIICAVSFGYNIIYDLTYIAKNNYCSKMTHLSGNIQLVERKSVTTNVGLFFPYYES